MDWLVWECLPLCRCQLRPPLPPLSVPPSLKVVYMFEDNNCVASVNGNIYSWRGLNCIFLDWTPALPLSLKLPAASCCCLSNKSLWKQQIIPIFLFIFFSSRQLAACPPPPWQTTHGNQPLPACFTGRLLFYQWRTRWQTTWPSGRSSSGSGSTSSGSVDAFSLYILQFCILLTK